MASVNKVILVGNLGRDPEVRYTGSGSAVCNLALATSRRRKDRETGDTQEETEWHRVVLFERLAEIAGEYLRKGRSVYIEGRLATKKWTDKDGIEKYTTEIIGEQMQLLSDGGGGDSGQREERQAPQRRAAPDQRTHGERQQSRAAEYRDEPPRRASPPAPPARRQPPPKSQTGFDDMDDDIPF